MTMRWDPKTVVKKAAEVGRKESQYSGRLSMHYRCQECGNEEPNKGRVEAGKKARNLVYVDHIVPVIDPPVGFVSWDQVIERMFCEANNLQLICWQCHDAKTATERALATERKRIEREG